MKENSKITEIINDAGFVGYGEDTGTYTIPVEEFKYKMLKFVDIIVAEAALIAGLAEFKGEKDIGAKILDNFENPQPDAVTAKVLIDLINSGGIK